MQCWVEQSFYFFFSSLPFPQLFIHPLHSALMLQQSACVLPSALWGQAICVCVYRNLKGMGGHVIVKCKSGVERDPQCKKEGERAAALGDTAVYGESKRVRKAARPQSTRPTTTTRPPYMLQSPPPLSPWCSLRTWSAGSHRLKAAISTAASFHRERERKKVDLVLLSQIPEHCYRHGSVVTKRWIICHVCSVWIRHKYIVEAHFFKEVKPGKICR